LLGSVEFPEEDVVVADFEAGVGTLTRLGEEHVDTVVIVVEATPKSIEVGIRAAGLASERTVARIVVVANRIRHDEDLQVVRTPFLASRSSACPTTPRSSRPTARAWPPSTSTRTRRR
jgi:CO dehydrogenase maturation factor